MPKFDRCASPHSGQVSSIDVCSTLENRAPWTPGFVGMVRCQYATVECSYVPTGNEVQMAIPQADPLMTLQWLHVRANPITAVRRARCTPSALG